MVVPGFVIPDVIRNRALLDGATGELWLNGVGERLAQLVESWGVELVAQMSGGTEALVFAAKKADSSDAVLKMTVPGNLGNEPRVFQMAQGRGYATMYAADIDRDAILLERLGDKLADSGLSTETQVRIICETLAASWETVPDPTGLQTGAEKAQWHIDHITTQNAALGEPLSRTICNRAIDYCNARAAAYDPATSVLVHGDAHMWNTLVANGVTDSGLPRYKFVDPDGQFGEKALDLCISLREWTDELLAGDTLEIGRTRLQLLSDLTDVPPEPIWQWGFIEHVSSGLLWKQMGGAKYAAAHFAIAEKWLNA